MCSRLSRPFRCDRVGLVRLESARVGRLTAADGSADAGVGGRRGPHAAAGGARGARRVALAARRARRRLRAPAAPGDAHRSPDGPPARTPTPSLCLKCSPRALRCSYMSTTLSAIHIAGVTLPLAVLESGARICALRRTVPRARNGNGRHAVRRLLGLAVSLRFSLCELPMLIYSYTLRSKFHSTFPHVHMSIPSTSTSTNKSSIKFALQTLQYTR